VNLRALQFFLVIAIAPFINAALLSGALSSGAIYSLDFVDIDGNKLSTADGHVTGLVLATTVERATVYVVG